MIILSQIKKCNSNSAGQDSSTSFPDAPSNMCCMSGCANCVWLDYAEDMIKYYSEKGEKLDINVILQEVEANINDPMIKSFIKLELKSKFPNKERLWRGVSIVRQCNLVNGLLHNICQKFERSDGIKSYIPEIGKIDKR